MNRPRRFQLATTGYMHDDPEGNWVMYSTIEPWLGRLSLSETVAYLALRWRAAVYASNRYRSTAFRGLPDNKSPFDFQVEADRAEAELLAACAALEEGTVRVKDSESTCVNFGIFCSCGYRIKGTLEPKEIDEVLKAVSTTHSGGIHKLFPTKKEALAYKRLNKKEGEKCPRKQKTT